MIKKIYSIVLVAYLVIGCVANSYSQCGGAQLYCVTVDGVVHSQGIVSAGSQTILNKKITVNSAGEVLGIKVGVGDGTEPGWLLNPSVGSSVAIESYMSSSVVRNHLFPIFSLVEIPFGLDAEAWTYLGSMNIGTVNAPDPRNANQKLGVEVESGGTFAPSAAFLTNGTSLGNRWKHGIWFDYVGGQVGSSLIKTNSNVSLDFGFDISSATINVQGLRIGNTPVAQVAVGGFRQFADTQVGVFIQRFTDTTPTGNLLQVSNAANNAVLASINAIGNARSTLSIVTGAATTVGAGEVGYGGTVSATIGAAGGAAALPATPLGYIIGNVVGTVVKIPYYLP